MPAFLTEPGEPEPDFALAGQVTLFWRRSVLDDAVELLGAIGYRVVRLDGSAWTSVAAVHDAVAASLEFPDYYGRNLNALDDCLYDVVLFEFGSDKAALGTAIAIERFDVLTAAEPDFAQAVLDVLARTATLGAKYGHRFAVLVQTDDPRPSYGSVGSYDLRFNEREWLNSSREIKDDEPKGRIS